MILVITASREDDCSLSDRRDYFLFDCCLAVDQMLLAANEVGIIAHPIADYDPVKVREVLDIPEEQVIITLVICGYPGEDRSLLAEGDRIGGSSAGEEAVGGAVPPGVLGKAAIDRSASRCSGGVPSP